MALPTWLFRKMAGSDRQQGPKLLSIDPTTKAAAERITVRQHCRCLSIRGKTGRPSIPNLHIEPQDTSPGWSRTIDLVLAAARSQSSIFEPSAHMAWEDWIGVITLPSEISLMRGVKELRLYGSHLRRLPPEIGEMSALENLDIYTSYSLHWLPYEITRCRQLRQSRMSTRALYGNPKTGLPFPRLSKTIETVMPRACSVCDRSFGATGPSLWWTTQRVGTDDVPLLIHSCSTACTDAVPDAPERYHRRPHQGGGAVATAIAE
jgi:hypothetical protein